MADDDFDGLIDDPYEPDWQDDRTFICAFCGKRDWKEDRECCERCDEEMCSDCIDLHRKTCHG
jgi:hypothetical protein